MKTVAFYSYKGGVGRSLALAYTAKRLMECNFRVCVVDFDLEAPGIIHKLLPAEKIDHSKPGTVDYIDLCWSDKPPESITEYFYDCKKSRYGYIKLMSAGKGLGGEYWEKLGTLDWIDIFTGENKEGLFIFELLKQQIRTQLKPDFLLLDSRAGITIVSKVCCSFISDAAILLMANNNENFHGSKLMYGHIKATTQFKVSGVPTDVFCALTRISDPKKEPEIIKRLINKIGDPALTADDITVIHTAREVENNEHILTTDESNIRLDSPIKSDYYKLFGKILDAEMLEAKKQEVTGKPRYAFIAGMGREFTKHELNRLSGKKSVEDFCAVLEKKSKTKSVSRNDLYALAICKRYQGKPMEALLSLVHAVAIGGSSKLLTARIRFLMGLISLYDLNNYDEALNDLRIVEKINVKHGLDVYYTIATCLFCLDEIDECLQYFAKEIALHPDNAYIHNNRGIVHLFTGDTARAIEDFTKAIDINPDYANAYNNRGVAYSHMGEYEKADIDELKYEELTAQK